MVRCSSAAWNGQSTTGLRLRRFTSSLRTRAPRCIGGSPLLAAPPLTTGVYTTHVTPYPARRGCPLTSSNAGTGGPTAISIGGIRSSGSVGARERCGWSASSGVLGRLEEVRATVGFCDPRETGGDDAAAARNDSHRVRATCAWCGQTRRSRRDNRRDRRNDIREIVHVRHRFITC